MRKLLFALSAASLLLFAGCGRQTTQQAIVKPARQTVQFPKPKDIQHVYVLAGLAAVSYTPRNSAKTVAQIEEWLKTAKPISVQFPPPPNPPIVQNANTNPAVLALQLSSKKVISISPAFYMAGHSQELNQLYHFVSGVISYNVGSQTVYFTDPELYNWLKNNQWQKQFNTK